ncbi:MAG TPA: response regulator [Bryobacteraceae bacterium]|nr:response regulator [Bryobacteraceae bacterium]
MHTSRDKVQGSLSGRENISVHVITTDPGDREVLGQILSESGCNVSWFASVAEARHKLSDSPAVVLCETDLPDGSWRDLLALTSHLDAPSRVLVTSRVADENLWAEVLHLGGYDVIAKPYDTREVSRAIQTACRP